MSRFVIRTAQSGPPGLPSQLPIAGRTVTVLTDDRGAPAFHAFLDAPLRFYLDSNFDGSRISHERFGRDEGGPFLWVGEIIMSPHRADEQPYPGMTNFHMDVRAVLSPVGAGAPANEIATTALGILTVDDLPEAADPVPGPLDAAPPAHADEPALRPVTPTPLPSSGAPPVPMSAATAADGAAVTEAAAQRGVAQLRGQIANLLGWPLTAIAEPKCVKAGRENQQGGPAYSANRGTLRYFTSDVWDGFVLRETTDLDELLYWIADDVTRSAAWEWTTRTPSFDTVDRTEARRVIAMPMWQTLMHALRYDWGRRTRANAHSSRAARARGA